MAVSVATDCVHYIMFRIQLVYHSSDGWGCPRHSATFMRAVREIVSHTSIRRSGSQIRTLRALNPLAAEVDSKEKSRLVDRV